MRLTINDLPPEMMREPNIETRCTHQGYRAKVEYEEQVYLTGWLEHEHQAIEEARRWWRKKMQQEKINE